MKQKSKKPGTWISIRITEQKKKEWKKYGKEFNLPLSHVVILFAQMGQDIFDQEFKKKLGLSPVMKGARHV